VTGTGTAPSMRRRVLYDATSRAAAAAAELLRPDFDIAPLVPSTEPTESDPAVVLIGADARDGLLADPSRRVSRGDPRPVEDDDHR